MCFQSNGPDPFPPPRKKGKGSATQTTLLRYLFAQSRVRNPRPRGVQTEVKRGVWRRGSKRGVLALPPTHKNCTKSLVGKEGKGSATPDYQKLSGQVEKCLGVEEKCYGSVAECPPKIL